MGIYDNPPPHPPPYHHHYQDQHHHDHGPPHDHHCPDGREWRWKAGSNVGILWHRCPVPIPTSQGSGYWATIGFGFWRVVALVRFELKPSLMMMSRTWTWTCHEHNTGEI